MKHSLLLLTVAAALLTDCAGTEHKFVVTTNVQDGSTVERMEGNVLAGGESWHQIELNLERVRSSNTSDRFFFVLVYSNRTTIWKDSSLAIGENESLTIMLDGHRSRFKAIGGGSVASTDGDFPTAIARYETTLDFLSNVSLATIVEVIVRGRNRTLQKLFQQENFEFLNRFLARTSTL